ncbi:MAG TPA: hypothetical protein VGF43_24795 [Dongiaceae bacterium]|jgi:hypothetical protein
MATTYRDEDLQTRDNMAGAKRMAIGLGVILVVALVAWEIFGAHDRLPTITHTQTISGPNPGEGKDATQPPAGAPAASNAGNQSGNKTTSGSNPSEGVKTSQPPAAMPNQDSGGKTKPGAPADSGAGVQ